MSAPPWIEGQYRLLRRLSLRVVESERPTVSVVED
jgi:hypothetical protein